MFDLDNTTIQLECPACRFHNPIFYRQARLRDALICRGCKATIQLDDNMNECRGAQRQVQRALNAFEDALGSLNRTLTIKL